MIARALSSSATHKKTLHAILIALSLLVTVLLFYLGDVSWLGSGKLSGGFWSGQAYHELSLLLLIGPVIYASIIFRVRGGIIASLVSSLAILPHAFFFSPYPDPFFRLITFAVIGVLLAGFIGSQLNSRTRLEKEHARLEHFLVETIGVEERQKRYLARELHDESLQALVDISHNIDELLETEDMTSIKTSLQDLRGEIDAVVEGTRRFVRGLRPPLLEEMGIATSLKWLAEELSEEEEIEVSVDIQGEEQTIQEAVELALFRIAQEALNNAKKHSHATRIQLALSFTEEKVQLRIADNGVGFSVPAQDMLASEGKFGLIGMEERAHLAGGAFRIESTAGQGTVITVEMPVGERD
jgi:signal transduction histidine kinase